MDAILVASRPTRLALLSAAAKPCAPAFAKDAVRPFLSKQATSKTLRLSPPPLQSSSLLHRNVVSCNAGKDRFPVPGSEDPDSDCLPDSAEWNATESNSKRREMLISFASFLTLLSSSSSSSANAQTISSDVQFEGFKDAINAYEFKIPLKIPNTDKNISWVESRKPERYSSAAPLAPDARQRIVYERLDFINNIVVSVSVGPPNKVFLSNGQSDTDTWRAIDVARSVLADKSTARMSVEQRVQEILIEDTSIAKIDGETYWFYEHLAQKSPTISDNSIDVYRHSLAVSAFREGYIYSLNVSTLNSKWPKYENVFKQMVESFRLTPVTKDYVPPWKDPWRFW